MRIIFGNLHIVLRFTERFADFCKAGNTHNRFYRKIDVFLTVPGKIVGTKLIFEHHAGLFEKRRPFFEQVEIL